MKGNRQGFRKKKKVKKKERLKMDISVIIPTREPEEYIYEALNSILDQSFSRERYEILVILNGEREPYLSDLNRFLNKKTGQRSGIRKKFSGKLKSGTRATPHRIRVVHEEREGVSRARNLGLEWAQGEYVVFMDDDDVVSRDYLQELYRYRRRYGIATGYVWQFLDKSLEEVPFFSQEFLRRSPGLEFRRFYPCRKIFSTCWGHIIPRRLIGETRFDEKLKNGEDSLFMAEISRDVKIVKVTGGKASYGRRIRENSAYHREKIDGERIRNRIYLLKRYWNLLWTEGYQKEFIASRMAAVILGIIRS